MSFAPIPGKAKLYLRGWHRNWKPPLLGIRLVGGRARSVSATAKIKKQAVTAAKVKNGTLTGTQINPSTPRTVAFRPDPDLYFAGMAEVASEATHGQHDRHGADSAPTVVVERFLDHLRTVTDNDAAAGLLAVDVAFENSWLPTLHGRERVRRLFQALVRMGTGLEIYVHAISADGSSVLTERTDVLKWGPLRVQFWICGRFDVRDGQISVWREYYDPLTILAATVRGLIGTVVPAARAKAPPAV